MPDNPTVPVAGPGPHGIEAAAKAIAAKIAPDRGTPPTIGPGDEPESDNRAPAKPEGDKPAGKAVAPDPTQTPAKEPEPEFTDADFDDAPAADDPATATAPDDGPPTTFDALATKAGITLDNLLDMTITRQVNGKDEAITIREARDGNQRLEDYRQKTAELSEQGKAAHQERAAVQAERQHYAQNLEPLVAELGEMVRAEDAYLQQLLAEDPTEYHRQKAYVDQRKERLAAAAAEQQRIGERHAQTRQAELSQDIERNALELIQAVPAWGKDPAIGKKEIAEIKDFAAKTYGLPRESIDAEYRSGAILAARDAMKYRKLVENRDKRVKEVRTKPKSVRAGAAERPVTANEGKVRKARAAHSKTGSVESLAAVLRARMQ